MIQSMASSRIPTQGSSLCWQPREVTALILPVKLLERVGESPKELDGYKIPSDYSRQTKGGAVG